MAELAKRRHGLEPFLATCAEIAGGDAGVEISIQRDVDHINLRGDPDDKKFITTVKSVLGQDLPVTANTVSEGKHRIYWLGPNEWLVVTQRVTELLPVLRESLAGQHASATDVCGAQVSMLLSGPGVTDVLAKGCTLDFHADEFGVGNCAQSGLAKASVLIGLVDDTPTFQIVVRRSFAEYLALWLRHAASEYNVRISAD